MTAPRVLVVEDEPGIRESVAFTLRSEGYEVGEEETGSGALALKAKVFPANS